MQADHGEAVVDAVERALVAWFGRPPARASMSFVGVDPIEVLRFDPAPDERVLVSRGMSARPMTGAAEVVYDAEGPRAELLIRVRDPLDRFADLWRAVALLAAAPAVEAVVYRPGMTVDTGAPLARGTLCTGCVVAESEWGVPVAPAGPVDVLRLIPATPNELAWSRVHGSDALRELWERHGVDLLDPARAGAPLR